MRMHLSLIYNLYIFYITNIDERRNEYKYNIIIELLKL